MYIFTYRYIYTYIPIYIYLHIYIHTQVYYLECVGPWNYITRDNKGKRGENEKNEKKRIEV